MHVGLESERVLPCTPSTSLPFLSSAHKELHDHKDETSL